MIDSVSHKQPVRCDVGVKVRYPGSRQWLFFFLSLSLFFLPDSHSRGCAENHDLIGWGKRTKLRVKREGCQSAQLRQCAWTDASRGHALLLWWWWWWWWWWCVETFSLFLSFFFFNTLFLTEGAGVSRLIWLQVKCDVLAACCEISLTTTASTSSTTTGTTITDAPSREWWALSWPDREVSISTASCPRGDARGMTARGRAREVAAETSCLPPWCSSPTSCQGCCGKPTTAHMWGGWRGSGRSRGFSGSRRRSRRPKCSNCCGRWGGGRVVTGGIAERNFYFETLWLKKGFNEAVSGFLLMSTWAEKSLLWFFFFISIHV